MPTRPSLETIPQSTSSQILHHPHRNPIHRLYPLFAQLKFHILPDKLDGDLEQIYEIVSELGGMCVSLEESRLVVTALRGRPRILRTIGKEWIDSKPIVSEAYIHATFQRCLDAATDGSILPTLPPRNQYIVRVKPPLAPASALTSVSAKAGSKREVSPEQDSAATGPLNKRRKTQHQMENGNGNGQAQPQTYLQYTKTEEPVPDSRDIAPLDEDVRFQDIPRYCVLRPCPLICVNQDLINAIKPIYDEREFEENQQKNSNVLSYRRSMSIMKSVPRRIRSGTEARKLEDLGEKVAQRIDEFLETGQIAETEEILASPRYAALKAFASVYTIGHHTAKELYDRHNCRTLEDVRAHYQSIAEESEEVRLKVKERRRKEGGMTHVDIVEEWMKLKDELDAKIPREEVEEIATCVMEHLSVFIPGCHYTITGGYRRGKTESNDVDVVFCPPERGQDIGLLHDLYRRLSTLNLITHVLHVTNRAPGVPIHATPNNFDNLDKAFVIFRLPGEDRKHRRVDLISAPKDRYAAAVLSWSGSMMFERDLRRYAEAKGLKFRAGLIEASTSKEINFETEREIFDYLGLRYVPPTLRNADG